MIRLILIPIAFYFGLQASYAQKVMPAVEQQEQELAIWTECGMESKMPAVNPGSPIRLTCRFYNPFAQKVSLDKLVVKGCKLTEHQFKGIVAEGISDPSEQMMKVPFSFICEPHAPGILSGEVIAHFSMIGGPKKNLEAKTKFKARILTAAEAKVKANCQDLDLTSRGGSLEKTSPSFQKIGSCGAHAGLLAYDAWRFAHGTCDQRHSSPGAEYLMSCKSSAASSSWDNGMDASAFLTALLTNPPCAYKNEFVRDSEGQCYDSFEVLADKMNQGLSKGLSASRFKQDLRVCSKAIGIKVGSVSLEDVRSALRTQDALNLLQKIVRSNCDPSEKLKLSVPYELNYLLGSGLARDKNGQVTDDRRVILPNLHSRFSKNGLKSQPIVAGFCAKKIFKNLVLKDPKDECGSHAVLIAGRRFNPEKAKCELLIQNSWDSWNLQSGERNPNFESAQEGKTWIDDDAFVAASNELFQLQ